MKTKMEFWHYPKCTTCQKALQEIRQTDKYELSLFDIKLENPNEDILRKWHSLALGTNEEVNLNSWFNSSGLLYRELNLKDKLNDMSDDEKISLLASNGMLIKRPVIILPNAIFFGFKKSTKAKIC